ncbi:tetratricopeptide repeat protein [Actinoplanes sp. TBRC 11911]|uniref:AfsR/SARP family transcriptional regulator n=1 Tax=Actinoplanes sp. TBRC 11911 TaxID=2729386 RepID=UPI00145DBE20|nr:tetratricopeptide repeat protein [Actinoplanes sp. TBRC 11911]NMO49664.1 tetratricopeptide repeat protein [Actinoplanes sp. TBRC 11911]
MDSIEVARPVPPPLRMAVMGPVRAWRGDEELNLGPRQQRQVLGLLMARAGRYVTIGELVDLLWGRSAPASGTNSVHRFIGSLRRILEPDLAPRSDGRWIVRRDAAYRLIAPESSLDLLEFRRLADEAREAENLGFGEVAIARYIEALRQSRGRCADDGTGETRRHAAFVAVDEEYAAVARDAARAAVNLNGVGPLLPPIRRAAEMNPLDEALQARMMLLLAADGRQADAFALFQEVREALSRELGVDPGPELRHAYDEVLKPREQPALAGATAATVSPAQLPRDLPSFTGRREQLNELTTLLTRAERDGVMPIVAIDGMPGVGKSTLAIHWAYEIAGRFPDGQLYLDLRGHDLVAEPMSTAEALRSLLATVGIESVPADPGVQAALLRSHLAGRRLVMLLDNAESDAQVRGLLPGGVSCLVVVTSRVRLAALNARDGAELVTLEPLSPAEARSLLTRRLSAAFDDQNLALDELVELTGRLPSALAALSSYILACPQPSFDSVLADLRGRDNALDLFGEQGVLDVRESFATSYRRLSEPAARLFRLLPQTAGPDVAHAATASLAGLPLSRVRPLLVELDRSHLLRTSRVSRLSLHPLVRRYASELSTAGDSAADRLAARQRLFQHYRHTAHAACAALRPLLPAIDPGRVPADVTVPSVTAHREALAWFRAEIAVLEDLVERSADFGAGAGGWQLATTLIPYYQRDGRAPAWLATMRHGLRAAEQLGDRAGQAHLYRGLAAAYSRLGDQGRARDDLRRAQRLFAELGLTADQAYVHHGMADVLAATGRYPEAIAEFERGRALFRAAGHRKGVAAVLTGIASCRTHLGEHEAAARLFEQAIALYLRLGDDNGLADDMRGLGDLWRGIGDNGTAADYLRRAVELYREVGDRAGQAQSLVSLGDARSASGNPRDAVPAWRDALDILDDLRLPAAVAVQDRLRSV